MLGLSDQTNSLKQPSWDSQAGTQHVLKAKLSALLLSAALACAPAHAQLTKEAQALVEFGKEPRPRLHRA